MTDRDPEGAQARAAMRTARLRRAGMIRRRIIGGSVALFVAAWLLIAIVLVSGNDPALAKHTSASTAASSTPATGTTSSSTSSQSSGSSGSSSLSSSSGNSGSGSVSSVTTSQS